MGFLVRPTGLLTFFTKARSYPFYEVESVMIDESSYAKKFDPLGGSPP
jgi:hypothetical protein